MTVLVADDHDINRKLLRTLLTAEGYDVVEAADGNEALRFLQDVKEPVVGLIDWEMPQIEGIEVCRETRTLNPDMPLFLILVTVRDTKQDVVAGLQAGRERLYHQAVRQDRAARPRQDRQPDGRASANAHAARK